MKKIRKFTLNLLKITLGIFAITGCSNEISSSSSSESSSIEPVSRIMVTPPDSVIVGKDYNLDDYVEVYGGPGSKIYDVKVKTTSTASVTDHTLTVLAEGTITLDISAGEQKSRFSTKGMMQIMADYQAYTAKIEYNYAMIGYNYDTGKKTNENYIHNDKYVLREYQDSVGIVPVNGYEGLIEYRDGSVYQFTANKTLSEETLDVNGAVLAGTGWFHYFYVSMAFPAEYDYFQAGYDSNGTECLYMDASKECTIDVYKDYFGGTMIGELYFLMYYGMCINVASFSWDKLLIYKNPTGEGFYFYWQIKEIATGNLYYISYDYLSVNKTDYTRDVLDQFIDYGEKPEMPSIKEATTFLDNFKAADFYTLDINWYGYNFSTGKHTSDYEKSVAYVNKENSIYLDYINVSGEETTTGISGFSKEVDEQTQEEKIYSFETNAGVTNYNELTEVSWESVVAVATSSYVNVDDLASAVVSYRNVDAKTGDVDVAFSTCMTFIQTMTTLLGNMGSKLTSRTDLTEDWWNATEVEIVTSADNSSATVTVQYAMYADEAQSEYLYCEFVIANFNNPIENGTLVSKYR